MRAATAALGIPALVGRPSATIGASLEWCRISVWIGASIAELAAIWPYRLSSRPRICKRASGGMADTRRAQFDLSAQGGFLRGADVLD